MSRRAGRSVSLAAVGLLAGLSVTRPAAAATITVTGTGDTIAVDGAVTLREAIASISSGANVNADVVAVGAYGTGDTINFNIPGAGVHTIAPSSTLPIINVPMTINGYSQPGASPNTLTSADNAVLLIEIDGAGAGAGAQGFAILTSNVVIRGLVVNRFANSQISILSGSNNVVAGNFIGTDPSGTASSSGGAGIGVALFNATTSTNTIGGTGPADRNVISGNNAGVLMTAGTTGNRVFGSLIGTNAAATGPLANSGDGIAISGGASGNFVGNDSPGTPVTTGNTIAFNAGSGVSLSGIGTFNNVISSNSIFSNGALGIDLGSDGVTPNDACDADPFMTSNGMQNFPVLTLVTPGAGTTTVQGTLNSTASRLFVIEFFSNAACDPSGNGEGQTLLGFTNVSTNASCAATFNVTFPVTVAPGQSITATATEIERGNSTSEFSACFLVPGGPPPPPTPTTGPAATVPALSPAMLVLLGLGLVAAALFVMKRA